MIKCMNKQCANYKQELEENTEICPACNEKTTNVVSKSNNKLGSIAAIIAVAFIVAPFLLPMFIGDIGLWGGFVVGIICIGISLYSRSIPAIIVSVLASAASIGLLFYFLNS